MNARPRRQFRRSTRTWPGAAALVAALIMATACGRPSSSGSGADRPTRPLTGALTPARSPRNANYTIDAKLDPATRTITATATITWRNITSQPTAELQFHVYWNAWRDARSTFLRERALAGGGASGRDDGFAQTTLTSLTVSRPGEVPVDVLAASHFIAPDDGNHDDATVLRVPLEAAIAPGQTARVDLSWSARVPRPFARTGVIGDFYFLAQWFPKLGVLEEDGWNCHQFHANTEFFSDFGVYAVRLTVPQGWQVGASGVERERTDNPDGTSTFSYYQEDIHDFAWTTSPSLIERSALIAPAGDGTSSQDPVWVRLLLQPEHLSQADAHFAAARTALTYFPRWSGTYPYEQLTIVDPAFQSDADGMEYPTLITAGTPWWNGAAVTISTPEEVVIHEAGHQFFYGIVASNEFEDAWMDEGLTTYLTARALVLDNPETRFERRYFGGFVPWVFPDLAVSRETYWNRRSGYRRAAKADVPSTPSFRYSVTDGRLITYNKTALWLNTLERHLGWPVMEQALRTYFARWQFRHPKPSDFFAAVSDAADQDLTWFFDQVYRSAKVFDYAVTTLKSVRENGRFRTDVIVTRDGEGTFPVDVVVTFEDGERRSERWSGTERWQRYSFVTASRAVSAEVDPEHVLLLDMNDANNSMSVRSDNAASATRWTLKWMVWLQDSLLSWMFLA